MQNLAVVYFPNIDSDEINILRKKYDPNFRIIPPHITLFFPSSDTQEDKLLKHTNAITKDLKAFLINLNGLMKSFDDYLFLLVKQGNEEIISLHDKLYSGEFAAYLQEDIPFIPHITLGLTESKKALEEAEDLNININCIFDSVSIIKGDGLTPPKIIKTFKLK